MISRAGARTSWVGRPAVRDVALPLGLAVVGLVSAPFLGGRSATGARVDELGLGLIMIACAGLLLRHRRPVPALLIVAAATSTYLTLSYPYGSVMLCLAVAVYAVARRRDAAEAAIWAGLSLILLCVHLLTNAAALSGPLGLVPATAWVAIPFTIGLSRRLVVQAATRTRVETERRLVEAERLRLATEVHDIIGHGLAAIQLQADVALHLRRTKPEQAVVALEAISRSSAEALAELRITLNQIGSTDAAEIDQVAGRAPTPGLDRLDDVCRRVREAGAVVELSVVGSRRRLPPAVDVAAYRIIQESLTNVVKHAADRRAEVVLAYTEDDVSVTVTNPIDETGSVREGFGIAGMRRRTEGVGGRFDVSTGPDTFTVSARLPCAAVPTDDQG